MRILCCLLLFLNSCAQEATIPEDILPLEKMLRINEQVLVLESHYQSTYGVLGVYQEALNKAVAKVLQEQHVSKKHFEKSVRYYAQHPELQAELNQAVMTALSRAH